MAVWVIWLILAGILVLLEIFTGTFYLLMIAVGLAAGGFAAIAGANSAIQFLLAAIVGVSAVYALRRSKFSKIHKTNPAHDPNINLDIGQTLTIEHWHGNEDEHYTARVMYRGAQWDVELAHGSIPRPGIFVICEVRGSRFIVSNMPSRTTSRENHGT